VKHVESERSQTMTLAQRQAALVAGLWNANPGAVGFDTEQIQTTADALRTERIRSMAKAWPALVAAIGGGYAPAFEAFMRSHLGPERDPLSDAVAFASWLAFRRQFPADCRMEWLLIELNYVSTPLGLRPRRGPAVRVRVWRRPWALAWGLRPPGCRIRCGYWQIGRRDQVG
jgi:hypothetical protein